MERYLVTAFLLLLFSLFLFYQARWLRQTGQQAIDTGYLALQRYVRYRGEKHANPRAVGRNRRVQGIYAYIMAVGVFYFATEFMFRAFVSYVGDEFFKQLSTTNDDLILALLLFCLAFGIFSLAWKLRTTDSEQSGMLVAPKTSYAWSPVQAGSTGHQLRLFGLVGYFLALSLFFLAIIVPLYGRILLFVSTNP